MRTKLYIFLIFSLFLVSCTTLQTSFGFGKEGPVGGKGVILKFIEAPDNNEEINEGYPFGIKIQIENNVVNEQGLRGEICLRDSLSSNYGGIPENECKSVNLPSATKVEKKFYPAIEVYSFGPYSYKNLEESLTQDAIIFADVKYEVQTTAGSNVCAKRPAAQSSVIPANCGEKQNPQVQQTDLPLKISKLTTKSSSFDSEARIDLEIQLLKTTEGQVISRLGTQSPSSAAEIDFQVLINEVQATCNQGNRIELRQNENEKIIKCFSQISLNQDFLEAPIRIKMGYGFIQSIPGRTIKLIKGGF